MKVLDLFSGIGGFSLGLERAGMETVAFCEIEPFCQKVLAKHWPGVPIYDDVRQLNGERFGAVDLICGGYPCQPFSVAGKRDGERDDRHLWPEFARLIREIRPRWVIGENVAGHITLGLDDVLSDLERLGYAWEVFVIPACAVGARHRRDRVWIIANALRERGRGRNPEWKDAGNVGESPRDSRPNTAGVGAWDTEPDVGRVANGVPRRVDRLRSLGNAVVPQIPEIIGRAIMEIERERP